MLNCNPATLFHPDAMCAPILANASAISADTPPCNTLNGCPIQFCESQTRSVSQIYTIRLSSVY
ncbi:hypothetical protein Hanom_Chr05g00438741 [Helianthus anomalus]